MELLDRIEAYLRITHIAATRFGRQAAGDPRLVLDLRNGRQLRNPTVRRLESYLAEAEAEITQRPEVEPVERNAPEFDRSSSGPRMAGSDAARFPTKRPPRPFRPRV